MGKKNIWYLHTYGKAYWPHAAFHHNYKSVMNTLNEVAKSGCFEDDPKYSPEEIENGYTLIQIDTERCPNYEKIYKVDKRKARVFKRQ